MLVEDPDLAGSKCGTGMTQESHMKGAGKVQEECVQGQCRE